MNPFDVWWITELTWDCVWFVEHQPSMWCVYEPIPWRPHTMTATAMKTWKLNSVLLRNHQIHDIVEQISPSYVFGCHGLWPSWSLFVAAMVCVRHCRTPVFSTSPTVCSFHRERRRACRKIVVSRRESLRLLFAASSHHSCIHLYSFPLLVVASTCPMVMTGQVEARSSNGKLYACLAFHCLFLLLPVLSLPHAQRGLYCFQ